MSADWGARLVRLAQGTLPSENAPVMRRNGNSRYVSEEPVVTPVTPVTALSGCSSLTGTTGVPGVKTEPTPDQAASTTGSILPKRKR